ncbi:type II and III secretion system protein family protein [Paraferrimonas sedimenticola]|uniref:Pilus assembly protein CpaC n=1 Tax=Paraferrimonas sedimenticola TaxID=375674 RepID=A0AA37VSL5_9GAMM|nr:type II and III secretion system protein family protein [Paraferrimonas sedimenticola]GLP94899.1 pilus assembly protein CpaC [Paraferrimonas sedimenticola]
MKKIYHTVYRLISLIMLVSVSMFVTNASLAGGPSQTEPDVVTIPIHKSKNLNMEQDVHRVSVGNPGIADILILRSRELYILGKKLGTTNVLVWDEEDNLVDILNLEVIHDLESLRYRLHSYLPDQDIGVHSSQGQLIVSGQASSLEKMNTAIELASAYAEAATALNGTSKVINMVTIGGGQQVMLEVVVAEVSTEIARQLESNLLLAFDGTDGTGGIVNGDLLFESVQTGIDNVTRGFFGSYARGDMLFNFALDVAKTNGLAKILAEPNITALSGQSAEFLSGGEFPVPIPNRDGTSIQFKDFGVGVSFVPTILDSGKINLNLKVLVSELSNANSVGIQPTGSTAALVVPSVVKRTSETTVELGDGQTIAIGGLLSDTLRENVSRIPGLGDIPVLGQLFRSQEYIKGQTELVIMVTPRLVRPFNKQGIPLPTDGFISPSDAEFYLLGRLSRRESGEPATHSPNPSPNASVSLPDNGGMTAVYGHEIQTR